MNVPFKLSPSQHLSLLATRIIPIPSLNPLNLESLPREERRKKTHFISHLLFFLLLAVFPVPLVAAWLAALLWLDERVDECGRDYSLLASYWILEGPRIFVIVVRAEIGAFLWLSAAECRYMG